MARPPPRRARAAASSVSLTNTSSSDGWISRIVGGREAGLAQPRRGRRRPSCRAGSTVCTDWPKIVAPRHHGCCADPGERARRLGRLDLDAARVRRVHLGQRLQRLGRAGDQQLRHVEVADLAAALGLVHVVGRDEERDPLRGEREQQVPQLAARDRIDAGGRLVEEDDARLVHQRGAERQPLLPAARQQPGAAIEVRARCASAPTAASRRSRSARARQAGRRRRRSPGSRARSGPRRARTSGSCSRCSGGSPRPRWRRRGPARRRARRRREQAAQDPDQRRLARAVRARAGRRPGRARPTG